MDSVSPSPSKRLSAAGPIVGVLVAIATLIALMLGLIVVLAKVIGFFGLGLSVDGNYFVATGLVLALTILLSTFALCLIIATRATEYQLDDEKDCDDDLDSEEVEPPQMYSRSRSAALGGQLVHVFLDEFEDKPTERRNIQQAKKRRAKRR
jgi:uncharacterized membrane protein (DUF485 family)